MNNFYFTKFQRVKEGRGEKELQVQTRRVYDVVKIKYPKNSKTKLFNLVIRQNLHS